jgi:hypothetical protein
MSGRACGAGLARAVALLAIALPAWPGTAPSGDDLAHCAGITAPDARLACYDSLAQRLGVRAPPASTAPTATAVSPPVPAAASATAPAPATAASTATAAAAASPPLGSDPQNFGLASSQLRPAQPAGPRAIDARIAAISADRIGRAFVVLDNGQTWTMTDADGRLAAGDPISIKRAALGSFIMTTASNHTYHVHRTQ